MQSMEQAGTHLNVETEGMTLEPTRHDLKTLKEKLRDMFGKHEFKA